MPQHKWTGRTHPLFGEVAEVLGIDTDLVMAAMETAERIYVLYTPHRENAALGEEILGVTMVRGDDRVLRQESFPQRQPDFEASMKRLLDDE